MKHKGIFQVFLITALILLLSATGYSASTLANLVEGTIGSDSIQSGDTAGNTFTVVLSATANTFPDCTDDNPCPIAVWNTGYVGPGDVANREYIDIRTASCVGVNCTLTIDSRNADTPTCSSCSFAEGANFSLLTSKATWDEKLNKENDLNAGMTLDEAVTTGAGTYGLLYLNGKVFRTDYTYNARTTLYRYDREDFTSVDTLVFPDDSNHENCMDMTYDATRGKLYVIFANTNTNTYISEVDPVTLDYTDVIADPVGMITGSCPMIATDGTSLYMSDYAGDGSNTKIYRWLMSNWSLTSTTTLTGLENGATIEYDVNGGRLYVTGDTEPGWIAKVDPSDMSYSSTTFPSGIKLVTDDLAFVGDYIWVGLEWPTVVGTNFIYQVAKSDLSYTGHYPATSTGLIGFTGMTFDGKYVWAGKIGSPGSILRIDPVLKTIDTYTLPTGYDSPGELISDGYYLYFTTWSQETSKIVRASPPRFTPVDTPNITLQPTTSSTTGIIYKGTDSFINDFTPAGTSGNNIFIGVNAGNFTMGYVSSPVDGSFNTVVGYDALKSNTTGTSNIAIGNGALENNTSGNYNVVVGGTAMTYNTTGYENTAIGISALDGNTTGNYNVAVGLEALYETETGGSNTAVGFYAGKGVDGQSFNNNSLFGKYAGLALRTGGANTFIGGLSGDSVTTGGSNICVGYKSCDDLIDGIQNLIIGYDAQAPATDSTFKLNIGDAITGDLSTGDITIAGDLTVTGGDITGNAATATALAANGANCPAGETPVGVDASGAVEGCFTPANFMGADWVNVQTDYYASGSGTATTGSIDIGVDANKVTGMTLTGWSDNMGICVAGAGVAAAELCCAKIDVDGANVYMFANDGTTPCNASTAVAGAVVEHDDTWAFKNAVDSGKNVYVPSGAYNVAMSRTGVDYLQADTNGQIILGAGKNSSFFYIRDFDSQVFLVLGSIVDIKQLYFTQDTDFRPATSGYAIQLGSDDLADISNYPQVSEVMFNGVYGCLWYDYVSKAWFDTFDCNSPVSVGILLENHNPEGDIKTHSGRIYLDSAAATGILISEADVNHWMAVKVNGVGRDLDITSSAGEVWSQEFQLCSFENNGFAGYIVRLEENGNDIKGTQFIGTNMANYGGNYDAVYIGNGVEGTIVDSVYFTETTNVDDTDIAIYNAGQNTSISDCVSPSLQLYLASTATGTVADNIFDWLIVGGALASNNITGNTFLGGLSGTLGNLYNTNNDISNNAGLPTTSGELDAGLSGTAKTYTDVLKLTNFTNAADMDTTGTEISFNQYYYHATTPATADSGAIVVVTETDWTSTASTQDAKMCFRTALDGTVADKMCISSAGNLTIGSNAAIDYSITFDGDTFDGAFGWYEDEGFFGFSDDILLPDSKKFFLGTSSDLELFHDGTDSYIQNNTGDIVIENDAQDEDIIFKVNDGGVDTEVARIQGSTGRFGIGTNSPSLQFQVERIADNADFAFVTNSDSTHNSSIYFRKNHADSTTLTTTINAENLGTLVWQGVDSQATPAWASAAYIRCVQNGTQTAGDTRIPTDCFWATGPGGTIAPSEKFRLTKYGITTYSPLDASATPVAPTRSTKKFLYTISLADDVDGTCATGTDCITLCDSAQSRPTSMMHCKLYVASNNIAEYWIASDCATTEIADSGTDFDATDTCNGTGGNTCIYDTGTTAVLHNDTGGTKVYMVECTYD